MVNLEGATEIAEASSRTSLDEAHSDITASGTARRWTHTHYARELKVLARLARGAHKTAKRQPQDAPRQPTVTRPKATAKSFKTATGGPKTNKDCHRMVQRGRKKHLNQNSPITLGCATRPHTVEDVFSYFCLRFFFAFYFRRGELFGSQSLPP